MRDSLSMNSTRYYFLYYYCHVESPHNDDTMGKVWGPTRSRTGRRVKVEKPLKREQNNRAMRHICHSNAIARDNRFSFNSSKKHTQQNVKKTKKKTSKINEKKKKSNFMPGLYIKSALALLLQLRLIKQTNRSGISMRSLWGLLLNTVAVKTNNPKAANEWRMRMRIRIRFTSIRAFGLINCQS